MRTCIIAVLELVFLSPAALFMTALVVRNLNLVQYGPTHAAQQLVMWYAGRMWTLWVLLLAMPMTVLVTGCATLRHNWTLGAQHLGRPHWAMLFVAVMTLAAAGILLVVILHMLAN